MDNYLFSLRSFITTWLSSTPTSWLIDIIFALLCGVGLFFLLLPYLPSYPTLPLPKGHRYIKKRQMGTRGRNRRRKKNQALKACRESLQELKETQDLFLLLQSLLGQLPEKGNFHQLLCQEPSAEMCKTAPAEAHLPREEPIDNAAPAVSPWASTVPLTKPPLPLASKLSPYLTTPSVPGLLHSPLSASQPSEPFLPLDHCSRQPLAPFSPPPPASGSLACPQPPTAFSAPPLIGSPLTLSQHDLMSLPLSASLYNKSWLSASTPTISSFDRSSRPILVPCSPQIVSCRELWPTSQNESQSLMPIAIQHLECHFLKKQKESWRALPFVVTRSQEAFSSLSSNLPQESQASQAHKSVSSLPGDFPVSPVLCRHLEQHLPKRFVQQQGSLPRRIHVGLEQVQPQRKSPGICQEPSRPSVCTQQSSRDIKKLKARHPGDFHLCNSANFQLGRDPKADLGYSLGRVSRYTVSQESESFEKDSTEESKNELKRPSGNVLARISEKKQVESDLEVHMDKKWWQINKGTTPMKGQHSWVSVSHALSKSDTQMETRKLVCLDGQKYCVNTSQELLFLNLVTQKVLEAHRKKLWVKHRWSLLLKVLKTTKLFVSRKAQASPPQQCAFPTAVTHDIAKVSKPLGEKPQVSQEEKVVPTNLASTLKSRLPAPSPAFEEIQSIPSQAPPGDDHKLSEAPLTGEEGRQSPQPLTPSIVSRPIQSETVLETQRGSLEPTSSQVMGENGPREESGSNNTPGAPSPGESVLEMDVESQSPKVIESSEGSPALQPQHSDILRASEQADSPVLNVNLSGLGSPGICQNFTPSRMSAAQVLELPSPKLQVISKPEIKMKVEPEIQPRDGRTDVPLAAGILASQVPQRRPRSTTSGNRPVLQDGCMAVGKSSLVQQESKILKPQAPLKKHHEGFARLGSSPTRKMGPLGQGRGIANTPSKNLQFLPEKGESPPERPQGKKTSRFLQWVFSSKDKGQKEPLQKVKPTAASALGREPVKVKPIYMNKEAADAEARELMSAVGQMLEEKIALQASELSKQKQKVQVPVGRGPSCHGASSHVEQRRVMSDTTCHRHDTPESCPIIENWIRDKDGNIWKISTPTTICHG
ncbi:spermatogenesis-associated protein 31A1-like [Choloepus didactylus]|uniref:spermatogenesis-associated protein 31A1-like n=1 Tax=Choloepus didactylus TaxID=27675 RepID=UPI00189CCCDB|nr:spermatogenesis-associated protein 31A1-like [Choloepus didactylus]